MPPSMAADYFPGRIIRKTKALGQSLDVYLSLSMSLIYKIRHCRYDHANIIFRQFGHAISLATGITALLMLVGHIISVSSGEEMFRSNTISNITSVAHLHASWHRTIMSRVGKNMGSEFLLASKKHPITFLDCSLPEPTAFRHVDMPPKADIYIDLVSISAWPASRRTIGTKCALGKFGDAPANALTSPISQVFSQRSWPKNSPGMYFFSDSKWPRFSSLADQRRARMTWHPSLPIGSCAKSSPEEYRLPGCSHYNITLWSVNL